MLREDWLHEEAEDGVNATHLRFHAERSLRDGWGADWARMAGMAAEAEQVPELWRADWIGEQPSRTRNRKAGTLRLVVSDTELTDESTGLDDRVDGESWQRPKAHAGYVAHREQFV